MKQRNTNGKCAICGSRDATTRDHIPPKGLFPQPRPQLITVPACRHCNLGASGFDEEFRAYLGLRVGTSTPLRSQLFGDSLRTLKHNRKLYRQIRSSSEEVPVLTPAGVYAGSGLRVRWHSKVHDKVVERCVRGLYFHHFKSVLGDAATVSVQWLRTFPASMQNQFMEMPLVVIGTNQFAYRYAQSEEEPSRSVWVFNFYGRHMASGYTQPNDGAYLKP